MVVQRFRDWQQQRAVDLEIDHGWLGPAFNFDIPTQARLESWLDQKFTVISLGGVKKRSAPEMRRWLEERKERGLERVHGVLVGYGEVHDRWVGRRGDFEFLMQTFRTALELGLTYSVTLYLTKTTLPMLGHVLTLLGELPRPPEYKHVRQFYYGGYAAHQEAERITETELRELPPWASASFQEHFDSRTERAWMAVVRSEDEQPFDLHLSVELTKDNIAGFESRSCEEICSDLTKRARSDIEKLPSLRELAAAHGDCHNPRVYGRFEVTRLWIDRCLDAGAIAFDRALLHEHIGRSGLGEAPALWG